MVSASFFVQHNRRVPAHESKSVETSGTADDKQPIVFRNRTTELNPAKSREQHVRVHARPLDLRPPVSPLVLRPPPYTSRFVSCGVVAKAAVEEGLGSPCHHARVTVARRLVGRRDRRCRQCWRCYHRLGGAYCVLFVARYLRLRRSTPKR